jgi:glycosyltransferase involved in cell wall biosynthesis
MRILFASGRAFPPERAGGAGRSMASLLAGAAAAGHQVEGIVHGLGWRRWVLRGVRRATARRVDAWSDRRLGYPVRRTVDWCFTAMLERRLAEFQPDIFITQLEESERAAAIALAAGIPTVLRVCDASFATFTGRLRDDRLLIVANSRFVAARLRERFGFESTVSYPPVDLAAYRVLDRQPEFVTLINPVAVKGVEVAIDIARRLPHVRFLFQESWPLSRSAERELRTRLNPLPNVTLQGVTHDMRRVYRRTAVLLVPSEWEEAFGRVVIEAQASGIPVVARAIGGLPETIGAGGVLLPPYARAAAFARAIDRILSDAAWAQTLSERALRNTTRPDLESDGIITDFLALLASHAGCPMMARVPDARGVATMPFDWRSGHPDPSTLREPQGRPEQSRGTTSSGSPRAKSRGERSRGVQPATARG